MKRILSLFSVLFLVTLVTFIMTDLAPSDSAEMYYLSKGITPSEEVLNETRHEMGLPAIWYRTTLWIWLW